MLSHSDILVRLLSAALLGGLVGLERERLEWAAGLRTHMLVCVGAALVMIVSAYGFEDVLNRPGVSLDPSRIAAQVVSGIGFLGAGTIIYLRQRIIRGLTTAASLWAVAAVGLAVGGGLLFAAAAATAIVIATLALLKPLERRMFQRHPARQIVLMVSPGSKVLEQIEATIQVAKLHVAQIAIKRGTKNADDRIELALDKGAVSSELLRAADQLRALDGVREVSF